MFSVVKQDRTFERDGRMPHAKRKLELCFDSKFEKVVCLSVKRLKIEDQSLWWIRETFIGLRKTHLER